jgi:hypothetical protein
MASITFVISFFILLLATYTYSAPVVREHDHTTPEFEFTTGTTIVEHERSVNMELVSDDESTTLDVHHSLRSFEDEPKEKRSEDEAKEKRTEDEAKEKRTEDEAKEKRTEDEPKEKRSEDEPKEKRSEDELKEKRGEDESKEKRSEDEAKEKRTEDEAKEKRSEDESKEKRSEDEPKEKRSEDEAKEKRNVDIFMFTTMETSTDFNGRVIKPIESEEGETSTYFHSEHQMKVTKDFEPSSSVDSFAKSTGLLHDDQTEESTSTYIYQHHDQSNEESTTQFPVKTRPFVKTVAIFPSKSTETKIYNNVPKETLTVI